MQEIFTLIGSYGFPIVCCVWLLVQSSKKDEQRAKENAEIQSKHDEHLNELRKVINDNTVATNNLVTLITYLMNKEGNNNYGPER